MPINIRPRLAIPKQLPRVPAVIPVPRPVEPYPFSKAVTVEDAPEGLPTSLLKGTALMAHLTQTLPSPAAKTLLSTYFNPRHPDHVLPGSVLSVSLPTGPFAGVLISIRRKGIDTSFTLRNVVQRTGVEMRFNVCSPLIKDVKIISRSGQSGGKRMRRAKLFYLRDQPGKMTAISTAVKKANAA